MAQEQFHYEVSHFCAGCPVGKFFHAGCVVEGTVVIAPKPQVWHPEAQQNAAAQEEEPLFVSGE